MRLRRWQVVGQVAVDSAHLIVVDPDNYEPLDWDGFVERVDGSVLPIEVDGPEGPVVVGAIVPTGIGDGVYPIEARFEGDRVAEVRVRFL